MKQNCKAKAARPYHVASMHCQILNSKTCCDSGLCLIPSHLFLVKDYQTLKYQRIDYINMLEGVPTLVNDHGWQSANDNKVPESQ